MMRKLYKQFTIIISLAITTFASLLVFLSPSNAAAVCSSCPRNGIPGNQSHGMHIVGRSSKIYLSHKPFLRSGSGHDFQAIYEVSLTSLDGSKDFSSLYLKDQNTTAINDYTLMPTEGFPKTDLVKRTRTSFKGKIFRGDFEECLRKNPRSSSFCPQNFIPASPEVKVTIKDVVYLCEFNDPSCMPGSPLSKLEYILFGDSTDHYLVHRITGASDGDFDQVLAVDQPVTLTPSQSSTLTTQKHLRLVSAGGRANTRKDALMHRTSDSSVTKLEPSFQVNGTGDLIKLGIIKDAEFFMETDPNLL